MKRITYETAGTTGEMKGDVGNEQHDHAGIMLHCN